MRKHSNKNKQLSGPSVRQALLLAVVFLTGCFFSSTILLLSYPLHTNGQTKSSSFRQDHNDYVSTTAEATAAIKKSDDPQKDIMQKSFLQQQPQLQQSSSSILYGKRILIALASFDFSQFPLLEEVLDAYQDLCFAGASKVDIYIHTTIPYTVALIDMLNTRLSCQTLQIYIVVKTPALRLNLVDCHRTLFYEKIEEYDLFIYSEVGIIFHANEWRRFFNCLFFALTINK